MGGVQKKLFSSPSFQAQPQSAAMDLRGKICSVNSVLRLQRPRQHLSDPQSPLVMGLKKRGEYATGKRYNRAGKSFNREQVLPSPAGSGKPHCSDWFCPATRGPRHTKICKYLAKETRSMVTIDVRSHPSIRSHEFDKRG